MLSLEHIEALVREGDAARARRALEAISRGEIPRDGLARHAALARRAGLVALAVRWLRPYVRPAPRRPERPTDAEAIEYAASLIRLGATSEAMRLLDSFPPERHPQAGFERAAAYIVEWRYADAIPLLQAYVRSPDVSGYQRLVGKVNLAAACVHEQQLERAGYLLRELLFETSVRRHALLLSSALKLAAISFIAQRDFHRAETFLSRCAVDPEGKALDTLFVRKWRAVAALVGRPDGADERSAMHAVSAEARRLGHWETCRDCDRLVAIHAGDEALLLRVFFGTPYEAFRGRLLAEFGRPVSLPESYLWAPPYEGRKLELDAYAGKTARAGLVPGSMPHRLLLTLAGDFYRPLGTAAIFAALYPGEIYHPSYAANRIHQTVRALRGWLAEHAPGVAIAERRGHYRLVVSPPWGIRVPGAASASLDRDERRLRALAAAFGDRRFTSREAARLLGIAQRSAARLLLAALEARVVEREGKRAAAAYRLVS